jgi:hypothetical protein
MFIQEFIYISVLQIWLFTTLFGIYSFPALSQLHNFFLGFPTFRPKHHRGDFDSRNAHLVHQNWDRISFTIAIFWNEIYHCGSRLIECKWVQNFCTFTKLVKKNISHEIYLRLKKSKSTCISFYMKISWLSTDFLTILNTMSLFVFYS